MIYIQSNLSIYKYKSLNVMQKTDRSDAKNKPNVAQKSNVEMKKTQKMSKKPSEMRKK